MQERLKNIIVGLVVIGIVLLAVLAPQYLPKFTKLHKVFDSPFNMGLVAVLVVLIAILDVKIGVAFAFLVLMFAVYLMDNSNTQNLENFFSNTGLVIGSQEFGTPRQASIRLSPFSEPEVITTNVPKMTTNQSVSKEGFADELPADKVDATNKIDTLDITTTTQYQSEMNMQPVADHAQKILVNGANQKAPACATPQQYDFLTQQVPNNQNTIGRFDVVGTRYDLESRPQNLTVYGPPLSWCGTYDQQQVAKCGTLFYPLNG